MMVVWTIQPHQYSVLTYKGEHIQFLQSSKYIGIDVSAMIKWYALCLDVKLVGKVIIGWKINAIKVILMDRKWKPMLFKAIVTQVLLYGVQVWGCTISLNPWNEIEKIQKRSKIHHPLSSYALEETCVWPVEILALQRVDIDKLKKSRIYQIID